MDNLENALSLNDFIASIPVSSLPRILQITSGVYLQSSIYDISGSECCLSTGDLLKVVDKELLSVSVDNLQTGNKQKLQKNFKGVFQVSADNSVYDTLGELHQKLSCDEYSHVYWFTSESEFTVGKHIIRKRLPIQLLSVDRNTNCGECYIFEGPDSYNTKIPLSTKGRFYECEDNEVYTVEQIIQDACLSKRNFKCAQIGTGEYRLCPEYEIKTVMHMRKGFVKMPSSLEVDVVDITANCGNITFLQPLSLTDVFYQQKFPIVAEILDAADFQHLVKNDTYSALQKGQKIIIYQKTVSKKVLATGIKGKTSKFFYIYDSYQGKFRQRPREFASIFELWTKAVEGTKLKVVVTQDCDSGEENFPSLCIGDHLQVLYNTKTVLTTPGGPQETDVLVCNKGTAEDGDDDDDDNEKPEEVMLPIYMEGRFVEEIKDTKKYNLSNIILKLKLPCEVKVVTKDTCLSKDPLASFPSIRLEEIMEESALLVSLYDKASECFELPVKYFNISVVLLEEKVASPAGLTNSTKVEELMECFYYNLRKDLPSHQLPPPRPPKREVKAREKVSCSKSLWTKKTLPPKLKKSETIHSHGLSGHNRMSHESKKMSEIDNGQKNMYSTTPRKNTVSVSGTDSDDDYEQIDDQICHLNLSSKVNL
ncbi:protein THEMIS2 isoform X1 [Bufo gargarizans]|uniref:protein THEMIS2 isoform X1 n=1 Tax=Bufo gargarizans TaxID=30331 RepID=UPI001CF23137|nr:protein THEMIS2 isoform X1 [Bufo gargarizans]